VCLLPLLAGGARRYYLGGGRKHGEYDMTDGFALTSFGAFGLALLGGFLSFLSPCVLPLVPGYLCFAAGLNFDELTQARQATLTKRILPATLAFVFGFALVFIAFGASAAAINPLILAHRDILGQIAGVFIIVLGLHMAGLFRLRFLQFEWRWHGQEQGQRQGQGQGQERWRTNPNLRLWTAFALGLAFAFGWTPCIGPILATILTLAAGSESLSGGVILLGVYAAGLGIPFIAAALAVGYFLQTSQRVKKYMPLVEKITGSLLVATGILVYFSSLQTLGFWLLEWLPALAILG